MIFFTDENISEYAAKILDIFDRDNEIKAHADYFEKGTKDAVWLRKVAGWKIKPVVVCGDGRILKNKVEKKVLKECGLMFVHLASGWTTINWEDLVWKYVKVWPVITRNVQEATFPQIFEVTLGLKVRSVGRISSL